LSFREDFPLNLDLFIMRQRKQIICNQLRQLRRPIRLRLGQLLADRSQKPGANLSSQNVTADCRLSYLMAPLDRGMGETSAARRAQTCFAIHGNCLKTRSFLALAGRRAIVLPFRLGAVQRSELSYD
jgi:hypothetical protein